ncbi:hypothetical protein [Klebsiella aerogenes]|uniref:hypothetical protein n=1 Tax=Klebsiella aerogenes TaxID=548 RepID=UPI00214F877F|nr:hypothetical protein [Klebsiella aerogenes]UUX43861.1 hypothetical protein NUT96_15985 [Klebsiella aerogenes]
MGSMSELETQVKELQHKLDTQERVNQMVFSLLIEATNAISPKKNVREVLEKTLNQVFEGKVDSIPELQEVFTKVQKIISK